MTAVTSTASRRLRPRRDVFLSIAVVPRRPCQPEARSSVVPLQYCTRRAIRLRKGRQVETRHPPAWPRARPSQRMTLCMCRARTGISDVAAAWRCAVVFHRAIRMTPPISPKRRRRNATPAFSEQLENSATQFRMAGEAAPGRNRGRRRRNVPSRTPHGFEEAPAFFRSGACPRSIPAGVEGCGARRHDGGRRLIQIGLNPASAAI